MTQIFDALSGRSPIKGRLFLEASAGCGKTFAIEHLVVQLLLSDASLNLKDLLIVTFTKAATKDLKRRIHETLMGALRECETDAVVAPYLKEHEIGRAHV